jgi:50S ribosomal protein L16 3-hydroxylase
MFPADGYNQAMHRRGTAHMLGGLTPRRFLSRHWQKRPLLVRQALPQFASMLEPAELMRLACREDAQSRVVIRQGRRWDVHHGPFSAAFFKRLRSGTWSLLVQDVNHFVPRAKELLQRFDFVPCARLDDLMISYAPPGGGVGPHFDSYDVFLVQGSGRRRWRIGAQRDLSLVPGAPLKLLARFRPEQEYVLEPGDMLYLPPGYAHDGVAVEACTTYSVGFRAPAWHDLGVQFLAYLQDHIGLDGLYRDPALVPTRRPAQVPRQMVREAAAQLARLRWDQRMVLRFLGCYLTEPKAHVYFTRPQAPLSRAVFLGRARRGGVVLDLKTQMLYAPRAVFVNGEYLDPGGCAPRLRELADGRALRLAADDGPELADMLYGWYRAGHLHLVPAPTSPETR